MKTSAILAICLAAFAPTSAKEISPMTKAESYVVANDLLARRRVNIRNSPARSNVARVERPRQYRQKNPRARTTRATRDLDIPGRRGDDGALAPVESPARPDDERTERSRHPRESRRPP